MPTVREQVSELIRRNADNADYWELLVLRFCEALLAHVDEHLRGIPVEESTIGRITTEDYFNLPEGPIELDDGVPSPKRWRLYQEGRHRLGFATMGEERDAMTGKSGDEVRAEYERRRAALRTRPFVPSPTPFSLPPEE